jgi:hypothetical protein
MNEWGALEPWRVLTAVNTAPRPELVSMRSRQLACCLVLIQQPEPSGSEAGKSGVRNGVQESLPSKHLTDALQVLLHAVYLRRGTEDFTSPRKEVRATDFITHKNPPSSAVTEPATVSPATSTLTTRPQRTAYLSPYLLFPLKICFGKCFNPPVLKQ